MPLVNVPAKTPTQVHAGGPNAVAFAVATGEVSLNTADPSLNGGLVRLMPHDTLWLAAGGPEAASTWLAYTEMGTTVVVTEFV